MVLMNVREYIQLCCVKRKISVAELARKIGQTPQNLNHKMQRNSFQSSELEKIAEALDCDLSIQFLDKETKEPL